MENKQKLRVVAYALFIAYILSIAATSYSETVVYTYDDLNRLDLVEYEDGRIIDYDYDEVGNREQKIVSAADTDGDGIFDDGDLSGTAGDNPCIGGNTANCDDNCQATPNADQADTDDDGVGDVCDNCREVANTDQRDTNGGEDDNTSLAGEQHYGNICDPDFDNNGSVGLSDYNTWRTYYRQTVPPAPEDVDLDNDDKIGLGDFNIWNQYYRSSPGPGIGD